MRMSTCVVCLASLMASPALAQAPGAGAGASYPTRNVRIVAPQPAGSGVDTYVRAIGAEAERDLGTAGDRRQSSRRERHHRHRAGHQGEAGRLHDSRRVHLGAGDQPACVQVASVRPCARSRADHANGDEQIALVVHPKLPVRTAKELVALAKARPGELMYASYGIGNVSHLSAELLAVETGVKLVHVPYKGATPAIQELIGGQVALTFPTLIGGDRAHPARAGCVCWQRAARSARACFPRRRRWSNRDIQP